MTQSRSQRGAWFAVVLMAAACSSNSGGSGGIADATPDVTPQDATPQDVAPQDVAQDVAPQDAPADVSDVSDVPADDGPTCASPMRMCGTSCIDTTVDTMNCGACGNACPMGQSCVMGACACLMGRTACSGTCVDTQADERNCGACGNACPTGQSCVAGACACPMGQRLCGSTCVDTATDTANCGTCGNACPASQSCQTGTCACAAGRTACGTGAATTCLDLQTDNANCGRCDNACGTGQSCVAGACVCPAGQTFCGGACVDTATTNAHCGACGNACGAAQTCAAGVCTCPTGQTACGTSCVTVATDATNCGRCGNACPAGQICTAGACACPTGQTACTAGGVLSCVDLRSSTTNCGACGTTCATGESCVAGLCGTVPSNDRRESAVAIPLTAPSTTLTVDTTGASNDTTGGCTCTSGRDVFYRFTLTAPELVYADTLDGLTWDSSLFLQDAMGANLTDSADSTSCGDDSCGGVRSQLAARLPAGTYFLVLSGCSQGRATIRFQHLPLGSGTTTRLTPTTTSVTVTGTVAAGTGRVDGGCSSSGPENFFYFTTCPAFAATTLHLSTCGATTFDTVLHQQSPARTPSSVCNDDFCGLQSSLEAALPAGAGLHGWYVDTFGSRTPGDYTLRVRLGSCTSDFTACSGTCQYTAGDNSNCGVCGTICSGGTSCVAASCVCPTGQTLCSTRCVDTQTDASNCGACGRACTGGAVCTAGVCNFTTSTRDVTASGTLTVNAVAASANASAGSTTVTISNLAGTFAAGDLVLLHQTQRASGALGYYEYRRVTAATTTTVTVDTALTNAYSTSDTAFARAQIVKVEEVRNLTVPAGATLTAGAWNGNTGGILAVTASGTVNVAGAVTMDGRGFRGRGHTCGYRCARGFQGEGTLGLGGANIVANGNGGGGGGAGQDDGSGAGGGYAAAGGNGGNGTCGTCREACPIPGGTGGALVGAADLSASVFLGGAGGEGGADEDGANPGPGGNGGGIILVRANVITNTGTVSARGLAGSNGVTSGSCGGGGCGMGGGGGGAGGAVRLQAITSAAIGTNLVLVNGAGGGTPTCGSTTAGAGSAGRIGVNSPATTGTTTPSFDRN